MGDIIERPIIYNTGYTFITMFSILTKIFMFSFLLGVLYKDPLASIAPIMSKINFFIKILISFFLMYRFNSFRTQKIKFTELDRKISYSAGLYIFTLSFFDLFTAYLDKIHEKVYPWTEKIIKSLSNFFFN
jgi:hypothetical protein